MVVHKPTGDVTVANPTYFIPAVVQTHNFSHSVHCFISAPVSLGPPSLKAHVLLIGQLLEAS